MAQSAITVTPPSPTPPTNFAFCGTTGPNPPNFTKTQYANPFNMAANGRPQAPYGVNQAPPPYFDDYATGAGSTINEIATPGQTTAVRIVFCANTAALAGGTGATSGGTENTYPGTGTYGSGNASGTVNGVGAVPAATSVAHEGAGSEVSVTATGSRSFAPTIAMSCLGNFTGTANPPNQQHASSLSPVGAQTITTLAPQGSASGGGTTALTVTGTNFTPQSKVYVNGVLQTTVYVSATSLTVAAAPKKATAGSIPVTVVTAGTTTTAATNWTFV